nr:uncharacterized protein LOC105884256 [Microcebus murinus]
MAPPPFQLTWSPGLVSVRGLLAPAKSKRAQPSVMADLQHRPCTWLGQGPGAQATLRDLEETLETRHLLGRARSQGRQRPGTRVPQPEAVSTLLRLPVRTLREAQTPDSPQQTATGFRHWGSLCGHDNRPAQPAGSTRQGKGSREDSVLPSDTQATAQTCRPSPPASPFPSSDRPLRPRGLRSRPHAQRLSGPGQGRQRHRERSGCHLGQDTLQLFSCREPRGTIGKSLPKGLLCTPCTRWPAGSVSNPSRNLLKEETAFHRRDSNAPAHWGAAA